MRAAHAAKAALATVVVLAASVAGCGEPERSAQTYCDKYHEGFAKIKEQYPEVDQYSTSDQHPLVMLMSVTSAYGDIIALIGDMSEVAPDEIQTDVERVHENMKKGLESVGDVIDNPLGTLASQLVAGIAASGAYERMSKYTLENCGEHMFSASPQTGGS